MRYEKMSKEQLLNELMDRGISIFTEDDSKQTLIEALYQEDLYENEYPDVRPTSPRQNEWQ